MSDSQVRRFIDSMEEQGVGVTRTKKGLFLRLPDRTSTTVHFTNSDVRAFDNLVARLRRAGVRHPEDPKNVAELPSSIKTGNASPSSKRKIIEAIVKLDYPDTVAIMPLMKVTGMEHITIARALYHMGFTPIAGKRNSREWVTPEELLAGKPKAEEPESPTLPPDDVDRFGKTVAQQEAERVLGAAVEGAREAGRTIGRELAGSTPHTDAALMDFATRAQSAQAAVNALGAGVPRETTEVELSSGAVRTGNGREFIDTHDSWIVDLTRLPMNMTIGDYLQSLDASGLEFEVRVWRRA